MSDKTTKKWDGRTGEKLDVSDELVAEVKRKKELMAGPVLFSCQIQSPAPLKDYCSILISKKGVLWRKWRITLRMKGPMPMGECLSHLDFRCNYALVVSLAELQLLCIFLVNFTPSNSQS